MNRTGKIVALIVLVPALVGLGYGAVWGVKRLVTSLDRPPDRPKPEVVVTSAVEGQEPDPLHVEIIKQYYKAYDGHDVDTACGLRVSCSDTNRDSIRMHQGMTLREIIFAADTEEGSAYVVKGLETHGDGSRSPWNETLQVRETAQGLKIGKADDIEVNVDNPGLKARPPLEVVKDYYAAMAEKDMSEYCSLRLDCPEKAKNPLMRHSGVKLAKVELKSQDKDRAQVHAESVETYANGDEVSWSQDWVLKLKAGRWLVDTTENISYEERLATKAPEDVMAEYYAALAERDEMKACKLRLECDQHRRRSIRYHKPIQLKVTVLKSKTSNEATVYTESLETQTNGGVWRWKQDWFLKMRDGGWKIDDTGNASYKREK